MPKRSSKPPADPNEAAHAVLRRLTDKADVNPTKAERSAIARLLGSRGGKKGGKARAAKLTPEQRAEIARKAAEARWGKPKP